MLSIIIYFCVPFLFVITDGIEAQRSYSGKSVHYSINEFHKH